MQNIINILFSLQHLSNLTIQPSNLQFYKKTLSSNFISITKMKPRLTIEIKKSNMENHDWSGIYHQHVYRVPHIQGTHLAVACTRRDVN